ncbi:MAG: hypothetical protein IPL03_10830 [Sterolibacteriaceae bacterium]|nr:hypothetical protein [Candidatus Methylophosphatis haderslevensis]
MPSDAFSLELKPDSWFELMHWHPDMDGAGNASAEARSACLTIARQYLDKALAELSTWGKPSQCWFLAEENDSGEDAIYVHTPNPNRQNFPYPFEGVKWHVPAASWLASQFPEPDFVHGQSQFNGAVLHWVVPSRPPGMVNSELVDIWALVRDIGFE